MILRAIGGRFSGLRTPTALLVQPLRQPRIISPMFTSARPMCSLVDTLIITPRCKKELRERAMRRGLQPQSPEEERKLKLRVSVDSGGCSGFQYHLQFTTEEVGEDDKVFDGGDVSVVVDDTSWEFLKGATLEFEDTLEKQKFSIINNPNAEVGCGCGVSFGLKM